MNWFFSVVVFVNVKRVRVSVGLNWVHFSTCHIHIALLSIFYLQCVIRHALAKQLQLSFAGLPSPEIYFNEMKNTKNNKI